MTAARAGTRSNIGDDIGGPSVMDAGAVAAALGVDVETGLSAQEAASRLAQNGPNELRAAPGVPAWRRVLAQFQDPLIYLLLAAVAIALLAWWVEGRAGHGRAWPVDAIVIAAVVLLNGVIGHVQEVKAQNAVAALARMTAASAGVLRDGKPQRVPSAEIVRGDVLVLAEGDAVGADARLLQATTLLVQEAELTGECEAVLTVLVFTSLFTCFTARSDTTSAFASLFGNPWLWSSIALSLLLQVAVVHVPVLNFAFGTAPLALEQWLVCAAMASMVLIYSEGQKLLRRRRDR